MVFRRLTALLPIGLLLVGCTERPPLAPACRPWQASDGTDPPTHCLFYPGGLALDPLGDVLYAANTNMDLSFGGATLVSIDVLRHERAVKCFRAFETGMSDQAECGIGSCEDSGWARGSATTVEDAERIEAATGRPLPDFDRCYCARDLDDPYIINCEPQRFVLSDQTLKIGNFPAEIQVVADDPPNWPAFSGTLHRGIYLSVGGDPSVTLVHATRPAPTARTGADPTGVQLDCGLGFADKHSPGSRYSVRPCADGNRTQRTPPGDEVLIDPMNPDLGTRARYTVPNQPVGLAIDRGCTDSAFVHGRGQAYRDAAQNPAAGQKACIARDGSKQGSDSYYQYLVATDLQGGVIAAFDLGTDPLNPVPPRLTHVSDPLFGAQDARRGAIALAARSPGDLSQPFYVTSRSLGQVSTFRLASVGGPLVVPGLNFRISSQFTSSAQDVRHIVFEPGGARAFLAVYSPPSLLTLDTKVRTVGGVAANQVTNVVNLCSGPSRLSLSRVPRLQLGQKTVVSKLYVTCYLGGQVVEVDPDSGLDGDIQVGRGPYAMALNFGTDAIEPCADPSLDDADARDRGVSCPAAGPKNPLRLPMRRGYVSAYLDNAIAVIDLDPSQPSYRRVISRIGIPTPKQSQ